MSLHLSALLAWASASRRRRAPAPPFTATEMMKLKRLADPQLSPDGKWVAYAATDVDLEAGQAQHRHLARPRRGRRAAPAHRPPDVGHARPRGAPTASASPSSRARRRLAGVRVDLAGGGRARSPPLDRRRRLLVDRRQDAARGRRRLRGLRGAFDDACQQREAGRGRASLRARASTTACSSATGTPGKTTGAPTCSWCRWTAGRCAT